MIKKKKLEYSGHLTVDDLSASGRRKYSWMQNVIKLFGMSSTKLFRQAASKVPIALLIVTVLKGAERRIWFIK